MPRASLSAAEARRLALAAQGLAAPRPGAAPDWRMLRRMVKRLGLLQIDSVNVLVRAHYLPLFARLGAYDRTVFDERAHRRGDSRLFEYWAHEASLLPVETQPLLRWRMARARRLEGIYGRIAQFVRERRPFVEATLAEVAARGPLSAAELSPPAGRRSNGWWSWDERKLALEYLFWAGLVTTAGRRGTFERVYDLTERVLPRAVREAPTPDGAEAQRALVRIAARAHGVATAADLRDYFRLSPQATRQAIQSLVEDGALIPVAVAGWQQPAYLDAEARIPRRVEARALLAPFDPLVWERARTERLFGFRYRIEIYTPAAKRVYGYYVLPFLLGDRLVARLCLKSDRANSTLQVRTAHGEDGTDRGAVAEALAAELRLMADWLGLERLAVAAAGDLAAALRDAMTPAPGLRVVRSFAGARAPEPSPLRRERKATGAASDRRG
ncbi:MAG TPA: crosslink repair DNA glycosylase YcaQ family protein [Stellaceae bacterium]|nr:crosslink repair DNA glycosylase YcaQ family protein [Stellaceae bacterium]